MGFLQQFADASKMVSKPAATAALPSMFPLIASQLLFDVPPLRFQQTIRTVRKHQPEASVKIPRLRVGLV
jgi:hypothetical protein